MKAIKTIYQNLWVLLVFITFSFSACKKWIDVSPKTEISADKVFSKEEGFKESLIGIYIKIGAPEMYGREMTFGVLDAAAQVYALNTSNARAQLDASEYNYKSIYTEPVINSIWSSSYNAIANINSLIEHLEKADTTIFQPGNYKIIKGEAYGLRALVHFDLLRIFGPGPLAPGIASPAIPYVSSYSIKTNQRIASAEVLTKIITDLEKAQALLSADPIVTGANVTDENDGGYLQARELKFNYYAAKALMARVYLWANDKPKALKNAEDIITSAKALAKFPWVSSGEVSLTTESQRNKTFTTEQIFTLFVNKMEANTKRYLDTSMYYPQTLNNSRRTELFETATVGATDYRNIYLMKSMSVYGSTRIFFSKLIQNPGQPAAFAKRMPMIRLSELFYIAAECLAESNPAKAVAYLNTVRQHRGITTSISTSANSDLISTELQKEYRKEFPTEGQLFFYYKRLNKATIPGYSGTFNTSGYVFPLPAAEIEFGS